MQQAGGARMTQTGLSLGTPQYMSPEQAMGEKHIDARADIYALGAVTYEMLTGEPPFTGATLQAIVAKVVSAEPEPPSLVRKTIPPGVETAVLRALAKLPADRFATAADFTTALDANDASGHAGRALTRVHVRGRSGASARTMALAACAIAALGLSGGWLAARTSIATPTPALSASVLLPDSMVIQPLLSAAEGSAMLALSPDGSLLVFAAGHGTDSKLYVRSLTRFDVRVLSGTDGAQAPFFTPGGDAVYFFALDGLKRVTLADGHVTVIHAPAAGGFEGEAWGGTVMQDGTVVVSQLLATELLVLSASGDSIRTIQCPSLCGSPAALPDGRHVVATSGDLLYRINIETGEAVRLTRPLPGGGEGPVPGNLACVDGDGHLVWAGRDGRLYAAPFDPGTARLTGLAVAIADSVRVEAGRGAAQFALSRTGVLAYAPGGVMSRGILVRADRAGKLDTIPAPADDYMDLELSPDGRRVAARVGSSSDAKIEVIDVATGAVSPWLAGQGIGRVTWTADGRRIAFVRNDSAFIGDPDAGAAPALLPAGTALDQGVVTLADTGAYLMWEKDSVRVLRSGRGAGDGAAMPLIDIFTATADGRWVIGRVNGFNVAYALDGSQRRVVLAPTEYSMSMRVPGRNEIILAKVVLMRSAGGEGVTRQTFYSVSYDAEKAEPFGKLQPLFTATIADFPGRNYSAAMGGDRFVFKQHIVTPPLREVRVVTGWHDRLQPEEKP